MKLIMVFIVSALMTVCMTYGADKPKKATKDRKIPDGLVVETTDLAFLIASVYAELDDMGKEALKGAVEWLEARRKVPASSAMPGESNRSIGN